MFGNLPLTGLRAFEALARTLSPGSAAKELSVTTGAVTRQVRDLEILLDLRLFERQRGEWHLTAQGAQLASSIAGSLQSIRLALDTLPFSAQPPLRIGISRALATHVVAPRLREFLDIAPGTVMYLDGEQQGGVPHPGLDLVVRYGIPEMVPGMKATRLSSGLLFPAAAPTLLGGSTPLVPEEWPDAELLAFMLIDHWTEWFVATDRPVTRRPIIHFSDSNMLFEAAIHGVGITMAHSVICHSFLKNRAIVPIGEGVQIDHHYYALVPVNSSGVADLFLDWLKGIMTEAERSSAQYLTTA